MSTVPKLTKREYDNRLFSVDVSGKLREGDSVTSFVSIQQEVSKKNTDSPSSLTVAVASTPITDNKTLNFTCSGGAAGTTYLLALRYVATSETQLESLVQVEVV